MTKELEKVIEGLDYNELCDLKNIVDQEIDKKRPKSFNDTIGIEELGIDPYVMRELFKADVFTLGDVFRKYNYKNLDTLSGRIKEEVEFILKTYDMDKYMEEPVKLDRKGK